MYLLSKTKDNMTKINKKMMFAAWACTNKSYFSYQSWHSVLQNMFQNFVVFDPQQYTYQLGRKGMNQKFMEVVKNERPDYIFFWLMYHPEFDVETLAQIKKISPQTKVLNFFGDDDILFDIYTKYLAFFVDYPLASHMEHFWKYEANNIPNVFSTFGVNTGNFKPINSEKKYDVTFIGTPIEDRAEMIKHLIGNGINVRIFGGGWYSYPELAQNYGGKLSTEEMNEIINQSKINLNFSKTIGGKTGFKAKVFEVCACKSFLLSEYFTGYLNYLKEDEEIVTFRDKEQLLEKVRYYLSNEKERENIAMGAYKKVIKNYSIEQEFKKIFSSIEKLKKKNSTEIISSNNNVVSLTQKELSNDRNELMQKIENASYITFIDDSVIPSDYKNHFQIQSLDKSTKNLSCCDYSVFSKSLGDYLSCYAYKTLNNNPERFYKLLDLSQLMVKKSFFIENLDKFTKFSEYKNELVTKENTAFIAFPLLRRINVANIKAEDIGSIFAPNFENELKALTTSKKLVFSQYFYKFAFSSLFSKLYLIEYLMKKIRLKMKSK